jgi:hypothetical protein
MPEVVCAMKQRKKALILALIFIISLLLLIWDLLVLVFLGGCRIRALI